MEDVRFGTEPFDRLTELCAEMGKVLDKPENADVKAIIMLHDGEQGGIQSLRLDDESELVSVMLVHLKAIFASHGKTITILTGDYTFSP